MNEFDDVYDDNVDDDVDEDDKDNEANDENEGDGRDNLFGGDGAGKGTGLLRSYAISSNKPLPIS